MCWAGFVPIWTRYRPYHAGLGSASVTLRAIWSGVSLALGLVSCRCRSEYHAFTLAVQVCPFLRGSANGADFQLRQYADSTGISEHPFGAELLSIVRLRQLDGNTVHPNTGTLDIAIASPRSRTHLTTATLAAALHVSFAHACCNPVCGCCFAHK